MSLSYQHIYHAGNPADIHKHLWLLSILLAQLENKEKIFFCDTHGGRGFYDLNSEEALKTKDADAGIKKINRLKINHPLWKKYQNLIRSLNTEGTNLYLGSPFIAGLLLRKIDTIRAFELHPNEFWYLRKNMRRFKNTLIEKKDMLKDFLPLMPPQEKQGCVLLDPSYEIKSEYETIPELVQKAYQKWPQGCFLIWYPMLPATRHESLKESFADFKGSIIIDEWVYKSPEGRGMYGSGIVALNAPPHVQKQMQEIKKLLLPLLQQQVK